LTYSREAAIFDPIKIKYIIDPIKSFLSINLTHQLNASKQIKTS